MTKISKIKVQGVTHEIKDNEAYVKPSSGIPASDIAEGVIPDISGKQDTLVSGENIKTINNQSILGEGNLVVEGPDVSGKADKVSNATSGNFAALDSEGNLTDSGHKHSDYLTEHQDISGKQDVITDLDTIRSGAAAGATAYQKPSTGIPADALSSAVQTSLGKADTALQSFTEIDPVFTASAAHGISSSDITAWNAKYDKPSTGIPSTDLSESVQTSLGKADTAIQDLSPITDLIPSQATSSNQLADKEFVNSSISTATATYKGNYNLVNDLSLSVSATTAQIATALASKISGEDNNDYCFVQIPTADATPTEIARIDRYKYNGTAWSFEYSLNNSGYTSEQWAAINSGITAIAVTNTASHIADTDIHVTTTNKAAWNAKYDKPSGGIPKTDLADAVQTSLGKADTALQSHQDISDKANKSEMAISTSGDQTTITLKKGTSTTVLNAHQDISGKVDKVDGKGLSSNDYTTTEKNKLAGIESGAQVNVIETIKIAGTTQTVKSKTVDLNVFTKDEIADPENYLAYGIEWTSGASSCSRIGNMALHKTLPVQSTMKGCVAKNGEIVYWLKASDWTKKEDGTASALDGSEGDVCVHIDTFYGRSWDDYKGTGKKRVMISLTQIDPTWVKIPAMLVGAYRAVLDREELRFRNIVNTSTRYRGGNNSSSYDAYLSTDPCRSFLGKPATNFSRATARTYARRNGDELLDYNTYKWIFYWLPAIEFCTFNMQAAVNDTLTAEGYRQGALGPGLTTFANWDKYSNYNPVGPVGCTNSLGNGSGEVSLSIPAFEVDGTTYSAQTVKANRYRGLECPFGDIWLNLDGVIYDSNHSDNDIVYTCDNPDFYGNEFTRYYKKQGLSIHTDGYVGEFNLGETGDILASSVSGAKSDYHYTGSVEGTPRTLLVGGGANDGGAAGPGSLSSFNGVGYSGHLVGFRTVHFCEEYTQDKKPISDIYLTKADATNLLAYGVEWDITQSTPNCTRIGNPLFHQTLPVQSEMRGCVEKNNKVVYWLSPIDWAYKEDGVTASVLNGTDGDVRVHIPRFYGRSWEDGNKRRVMISTVKIDGSWMEIPELFLDAYHTVLDRTNLKLRSIINTSTQYRGGDNTSSYDAGEPAQSLLGKGVTNIPRATMRAYAADSGVELINYEIYKWIFLWLPVIEYATFNLQQAVNNTLTSAGYHQGGLGTGMTTWGWNDWIAYNNYNPVTPNGYTNSLGNGSGEVAITANSNTYYANRYRGIENPFGDIWTNLDGVIVDANHSDYDLVYCTDLAANYADTITDDYYYVGKSVHSEGYVKEFNLGMGGDILAQSVGGGASTYKCDYHIIGSVEGTLRTLLVGGAAIDGGDAGPGYLYSNAGVGDSYRDLGFRTIKRVK